ncbi:hypothetical protein F5B22DRAFT_648062 [Xylaria bambusicola]|uniref:uncharacterized protein n=1 Tax=Xylaria bambusicola TaxID=326684 RepID=UPI002008AADE|nr:uncharacterized protein F5B22DRAFT_648062 [Xylaria bambusicola]KAI0512967.1 hypothetical protein F5B22DRAFT_648062 [Xylaria bambusicola]
MSQESSDTMEVEIDCVCKHNKCPGYPYGDDGLAVTKEAWDENFLIQCASCHSHCHGPCVGFPTPETADTSEFFCLWCRPHYHQLFKNEKGHIYSHYTDESDVKDDDYNPKQHSDANRKRKASRAGRNAQPGGYPSTKRARSELIQRRPSDEDPPAVRTEELPQKSTKRWKSERTTCGGNIRSQEKCESVPRDSRNNKCPTSPVAVPRQEE